MSELFRTEALAHVKPTAYGSVSLARPVSHMTLTLLFVAFAAALVIFFVSFSYTNKVKVPGILLPAKDVIRIMPTQAGLIAERRVREGQAVKAGDALFVLVSERSNAQGGNAEQQISELLQQRRDSFVAERDEIQRQLALRGEAARRKADELRSEQARIDAQVALQQRRTALSESALGRVTELAAQNFLSALQVQDKQGELLDQQQKLAELQRVRAILDRDLAALRDDVHGLQIQARRDRQVGERQIGDIERDLAENAARRRWLVRAPEDGTVSAITAAAGQFVAPHQSLASLLPAASELEAELYAPSRAVGFLRAGTPVNLRYQAFAYQKFGQARGTVREVSNMAMRPDEMALPVAAGLGTSGTEPIYRVRVTLPRQTVQASGAELALKSGMALDGSILLETRRLSAWMLEPLYTLGGQL